MAFQASLSAIVPALSEIDNQKLVNLPSFLGDAVYCAFCNYLLYVETFVKVLKKGVMGVQVLWIGVAQHEFGASTIHVLVEERQPDLLIVIKNTL